MIRRPVFAIVIAIMIVILGVISLGRLQVEQYPNITPPVVEVSAIYPGADATVVSQSIATPIAQSIMGVDDMLYMQATSASDGTMSLAVTFAVGSDPDLNTIFTQNRVSGVVSALPEAVTRQGITVQKTSNSFILVMSLYSKDQRYDQKFLSNYAIINIKNELLKINGVGKVNVMGAGEYSMRVWLKPDMMEYYNVNVQQIISKIEAQSGVFPVGKLGAAPSSVPSQFTYTVMLPPSISTPEGYKDIVLITTDDGAMVRLKDVARVEFGTQTYGVSSFFNASPAAMIAIYQAPGSNALKVGDEIKSTMQHLKEQFPSGIDYQTVVDTTVVISKGAKEIVATLMIALLLVIIIIYLFVQDFRAMIIPLVAIPVSLIGVFILFPIFGFSINVFSLLGLVLAIGLVVDDAIVVVEAVQVELENGLPPREATTKAMKLVRSPIIATTLVLAAVFIPVSLMGGITGMLYQQFAITIIISVLFSAINALTLSPALCAIWLRNKEKRTSGFFFRFNNMFKRGLQYYESAATRIIQHAVATIIFILIIGAAVAYLFKVMPTGLLPDEDQGYIMTAITLPDAASLNRTIDVTNLAAEIISKRKDVVSVTTVSGYNMLSGVASSSSAIIFTTLSSTKRAKASEIAEELNGELYMAVKGGECYTFGPPPIPAIGTASGFTMMLESKTNSSPKYLEKQIDIFLEAANKRKEIAAAYSEYSASVPSKGVIIDKEALMTEGVALDDLYATLATFMGGSYVNNFNRFGKLYQTYVEADGNYREEESDLRNYFVMNSEGKSVPISAFVTLHDTTTTEYITDFNLLNAASIMGNAAKGYSSSAAMQALEEVADKTLPPDMSYSWSGMSYQEMKASSNELLTYASAIIFIFLVLAALYENWYLPFSILLGIPFALFGALTFSYVAHTMLSTYADNIFLQISLIMLIGLSAKNAILIIEYAERIYIQGGTLTSAAIAAAKLRIRPIIMTALAFIIGVAPLIFATGSNAIARNIMGVALVGGMLIATLLGLLIYPALYVIVGKLGNFEKRREKMKEDIS
ncbi:MAG: efflux RND transporter permease subunit [Rikenellaceae bacterium]